MFTTNRLYIRKFKTSDLYDLIEQRTDAEVSKYISKTMSSTEVTNFLLQHIKPYKGRLKERLALAVELKTNRKVIGELMFRFLNKKKNCGEIGFRFHSSYQRMGYAAEASNAFIGYLKQKYQLRKIVAFCQQENVASMKLLNKLNMEFEKEVPICLGDNEILKPHLQYSINFKNRL